MKDFIKHILARPHNAFIKRIQRERFNPSLLGIFTNPFYFARKGLHREISRLTPHLMGTILDVGCGTKPYRNMFVCEQYDGLEIDTEKMRTASAAEYFYDGKTFPFAGDTYDGVVCNQVLEHVFEPDAFIGEIQRILKPNGYLLLTVPFVWDEHEQPHDFARYSSFGIIHLLERHGFVIVEARKSTPTIAVVFQMLNTYLYKKTKTSSLYINLLVTILLMAPFTIIGLLLSQVLPKNEDLYLDNIILAKKI